MSDSTESTSPPVLRVVRGTPDAAELAALVAVLGARGGAADPEPATAARAGWSDRSHGLRSQLAQGRGAWSRSSRTR